MTPLPGRWYDCCSLGGGEGYLGRLFGCLFVCFPSSCWRLFVGGSGEVECGETECASSWGLRPRSLPTARFISSSSSSPSSSLASSSLSSSPSAAAEAFLARLALDFAETIEPVVKSEGVRNSFSPRCFPCFFRILPTSFNEEY